MAAACGLAWLVAAQSPVFGQYTWTGAANTNWTNTGNWAPTVSGGPASTADIFGTSTGNQVNLGGDRTVNSMINSFTGSWSLIGTSTSGNTFTVSGTLAQVGSGTMIYRQGNSTTQPLNLSLGNVTVSAGVLQLGEIGVSTGRSVNSLSVSGVTRLGGGQLAVNSSAASYSLGQIQATGGTLTLNARPTSSVSANTSGIGGSGGATIRGSFDALTGTTSLQITNSSNFATDAIFADGGAAASRLNIVKLGAGQQTFQGTSTYSGNTEIQAGTLSAANASAFGTSSVTVNGTGTLLVSVSNLNAKNVSVATSGTVDLNGASTATITLGSGEDFVMSSGTLKFSYLSGTYDQFLGTAGGDFLLTGGVIDLSNSAWNYASTYNLFSGFGSGAVSGITFTGYDSSNYQATLGNTGVLTFNAVPEPSTVALAALGLGFILWRRRSSRAS